MSDCWVFSHDPYSAAGYLDAAYLFIFICFLIFIFRFFLTRQSAPGSPHPAPRVFGTTVSVHYQLFETNQNTEKLWAFWWDWGEVNGSVHNPCTFVPIDFWFQIENTKSEFSVFRLSITNWKLKIIHFFRFSIFYPPTAISRAVKHSKTLQLKGMCKIAKIS